jgi:hypothetical protein
LFQPWVVWLGRTLPRPGRLNRSEVSEGNRWQVYGERLTDCRDRIIHYAPIDFGMGMSSMQKLDGGVWSVLMRMPDNLEAKSKSAFTFTNDFGRPYLRLGAFK